MRTEFLQADGWHNTRLPRAVFLDRDGTLIRHVHYLHRPEQVELLPGVRESLEVLVARETKLFLFTNQSGVAKQLFTLEEAIIVNHKMIDLIGLGGEVFTEICIATELPNSAPVYRKPSPRFINECLERHELKKQDAAIIGDNPTDWEAGLRAGVRAIGVTSGVPFSITEQAQADFQGVRCYTSIWHWLEDCRRQSAWS